VVIGVMPGTFMFPSDRAQFWVPLRLDPATAERDANFLSLVGRLRDGATLAMAEAQVEAVASRIARDHPEMNEGYAVRLESRHDFIVEPVRPVLVLIASAVAVLLAIALANLVNLQLVRSAGRRRDRAVRRALGATGSHLAREQVAEGLWLAASGAAAGLGLAIWSIAALQRFGPALPRRTEIGVDSRAVLFAVAVAVVSALVVAAIGALVERRQSLAEALAGGSRSSAGRGVHRTQEGLLVVQLALALTLFVGAGLLGRSFYRLVAVPRGFDGEHVLTAKLTLPPSRYGSGRMLGFYDQLLDRLSLLPGVVSVSGTWALPFSDDWASSAIVPADGAVPDAPPQVVQSPVRPRFFETVGIPLLEGRDFTAADAADAPEAAIVNQTLARRFWPGESAVGKQLRSADPEDDDPPVTIVGVVGDIQRRGLSVPIEPEMYLPHAQAAWSGDLYLTLRTPDDPYAVVDGLRRTLAELDPLLPITNLATLDELVDASVVGPRFRSLLVGSFAAIAGVLAAIGIYGVLVFVVAQRRHEIAVRAALGATPRRVLVQVIGRGLRVALVGLGLGLVGAAAATPLVRSLLFDVEPFDVATYLAGILLLAGIAVAGSWIPARRAARVDPMLTLREEM
jgi:putative ABC transport system permease protein